MAVSDLRKLIAANETQKPFLQTVPSPPEAAVASDGLKPEDPPRESDFPGSAAPICPSYRKSILSESLGLCFGSPSVLLFFPSLDATAVKQKKLQNQGSKLAT